MKKIKLVILTVIVCIICCAWGFTAHKKINESAVFILPSALARYYKKHINTITEKAVDADKRCYIDSAERPRHYIDLDTYTDQIDSLPIHWTKAVEKFSERKLLSAGVIPWQIWRTYQNLIKALEDKNHTRIIRYSADLGHYVADAHVPLHTTSNYNGQFTKQIGIHAFWETRLPEMFSKNYNIFVGQASYIADPLALSWLIVKKSNSLVDSVLQIEKKLSETFRITDQKSYLTRNNQLILTYSDPYATAYHTALNGMVERRFRSSIYVVGCLWYSAWIDAGQPDLSKFSITVDTVEKVDMTNKKIIGREEWHN